MGQGVGCHGCRDREDEMHPEALAAQSEELRRENEMLRRRTMELEARIQQDSVRNGSANTSGPSGTSNGEASPTSGSGSPTARIRSSTMEALQRRRSFGGTTPRATRGRQENGATPEIYSMDSQPDSVATPRASRRGVQTPQRGSHSELEISQSSKMPVGLLFPNQSPKLQGMLRDVDAVPAAQSLLRRASDFLGYDLADLCINGPSSKLDQTLYCQPAIYVAGLCAAERLRMERPDALDRCIAVAGFGVGEYAALHTAGSFDFETGLELVQLRAEAMHAAAGVGEQQQLSITGVDLERARQLCQEAVKLCEKDQGRASDGTGEPSEPLVCEIAYAIMPRAHVGAGTKVATTKLLELFKDAVEMKANPLDTPQNLGYGAFQTSLMESAKQSISLKLQEMLPRIRPPTYAVYFNTTGESLPAGSDPSLVVERLAAQLTTTVLWEQTIKGMLSGGVEQFFVCSPSTSSQLRDVMRKIDEKASKNTFQLLGVQDPMRRTD